MTTTAAGDDERGAADGGGSLPTVSSSEADPLPPPAQKRKQPGNGGQQHRQKKQQRAQRQEFPPIEVEYAIRDGLRHVLPYVYVFTARAKGRWWGKPVLEVFQREFRTYNPAYYEASIRAGTITVNGQKVDPAYLLKNNDLLLHKCHRHEPPVSGEAPLRVIAEDERVVVVLKPATIPVHPCGAYRFNSVLHILQKERPDLFGAPSPSDKATAGLHVIYRLDRLTSGLLILAKSPEEANRMCTELQSGRTKKYYLALVKGDFASRAAFPPENGAAEAAGGEGEVLFDDWCVDIVDDDGGESGKAGTGSSSCPAPVQKQEKQEKKKENEDEGECGDNGGAEAEESSAPMQWRVQSDGSVDVQAGIRCVSYRDAVYECSSLGKPSRTLFRPLGFDGEHSLVACRPITGRTHQIRNHLQWLGFPIANDPNYGDAATVEAFKGQWGKQTEAYEELGTTYVPDDGDDDGAVPLSQEERIRRLCPYCRHGDDVMFKGEQLHHKGIFLHAWRYEGMPRGQGGRHGAEAGWAYETPFPEWARAFQRDEEGQAGARGREIAS